MSQRVTITVIKGNEQHDVNVSLDTTPLNIAAAMHWEDIQSARLPSRNLTIGGNDSLLGKVKQADMLVFDSETGAGWRR